MATSATQPVDHVFPTLVESYVNRLRRYGHSRHTSAGEVLDESAASGRPADLVAAEVATRRLAS